MEAKEKKILIGVGVAVVIIGGYFMFFKNDNSGGIEDPTGNNSAPVDFSFNAAKVAAELWEIMQQTIPNKTGIFNALRNVNQTQFGQVITAFGKRKYNSTFGNSMEPIFSTLEFRDLPYILKAELSGDYQTLKLKYPNYL